MHIVEQIAGKSAFGVCKEGTMSINRTHPGQHNANTIEAEDYEDTFRFCVSSVEHIECVCVSKSIEFTFAEVTQKKMANIWAVTQDVSSATLANIKDNNATLRGTQQIVIVFEYL